MLITKVKICGITNYEDAVAAMDMGADLLGFNFYPKSPRYVTPEQATDIINKLPGFMDTAGVFVNASIEQIHETNSVCPLDRPRHTSAPSSYRMICTPTRRTCSGVA